MPADKSAWSWTKKADCFSLYTRNVQLFFVCRMFFEELKVAAASSKPSSEPGVKALTASHAIVQFEHEFSDPIPLELPKVRTQYFWPHLHFLAVSPTNVTSSKMLVGVVTVHV